MFVNRRGSGTCNLKRASTEVNSELEANMGSYKIHGGDFIFHDRWLFLVLAKIG
jgi:hypothetical protein